MGNKNTIEFNGKIYDAATGALLKPGSAASGENSKAPHATDGFVKAKPKPSNHASVSAKKAPTPKPVDQMLKPRHQPTRSKTLMRTSVKKPAPHKRPIDQVQAPANYKPIKHVSASPIAARTSLNERRLARSQQATKSSAISRFKASAAERFTAKVQPMELKKPTPTDRPIKPRAKTFRATTGNRLDNILSAGLEKATSHEQPVPSIKAKRQGKRRFRHKWLLISGLILVALLISGFFVAHFVPNVELDIATTRSGVQVSMPSYLPAGFKFTAPVQYSSGTLTVNFINNISSQQFSVVAQNSDWDSPTLLDSFVIGTDSNYQTLQRAGRTLYVYRRTNVTWVNGGVWYRLSGSSSLSTDQLVDIASSM